MASLASLGSSPLTRGKPDVPQHHAKMMRLIPAHAGKTRRGDRNPDCVRAHPRSRGENYASAPSKPPPAGSSPLTRGKHLDLAAPDPSRGLIPAHAGKTRSPRAMPPAPRAHPRSRGENPRRRPQVDEHRGSSPLTRGKPAHRSSSSPSTGLIPAHAGKTVGVLDPRCQLRAHPRSRGENSPSPSMFRRACRLIPAHAGKTYRSHRLPGRRWAHPRSRGENKRKLRLFTDEEGSSPLTRGKRRAAAPVPAMKRLIPAHAGKTCIRALRPAEMRAHPRSRGENAGPSVPSSTRSGSSPLTRGKPGSGLHRVGTPGLIPAHAGKTLSASVSGPFRGAHPRSRGENVGTLRGGAVAAGSSPLTRGKLKDAESHRDRARLIPAHAGKTTPPSPRPQAPRAHPRSRGENANKQRRAGNDSGSSPLTRGKLRARDPVQAVGGLIPAHAGKTLPQVPSQVGVGAHPRSRGEN